MSGRVGEPTVESPASAEPGPPADDAPADPLPVDFFEDAWPYLRRPFSPHAIKFKMQNELSGNRGLCVPYIDARLVSERLNMVVGGGWTYTIAPLGDRLDSGSYVCNLTVCGITRPNVGSASAFEKVKGGYSDALKRAAVPFGVGVSLYSVPRLILDAHREPGDTPKLAIRERKGKTSLVITPRSEEWLRLQYEGWLTRYGIAAFGEVLEHGDVEGSIGAELDEAGPVDEPAPDEGVDAPALAGAREAAEKVYDEITKGDVKKRRRLQPARFKAQLENTETPEDIAALVEKVKNL